MKAVIIILYFFFFFLTIMGNAIAKRKFTFLSVLRIFIGIPFEFVCTILLLLRPRIIENYEAEITKLNSLKYINIIGLVFSIVVEFFIVKNFFL